MAGLYGRMVDPNFAAPGRGGVGANAGIGVQGAPALQRAQEDDFNAAQMAGLLGMMQRAKKPGEEGAAPAPSTDMLGIGATPGMTPITNEGNFDWNPSIARGPESLPNGGNFAMPPAGSGDAFQLGNVGAQSMANGAAPLMSNFGAGIPAPAATPVPQGVAMPTVIGGAGVPTFGAVQADPGFLARLGSLFGGFGFGG